MFLEKITIYTYFSLKTAALLLDYMDIQTIAEKTGLTLEEVEELKKPNQ